jgi:hypothetical protein
MGKDAFGNKFTDWIIDNGYVLIGVDVSDFTHWWENPDVIRTTEQLYKDFKAQC